MVRGGELVEVREEEGGTRKEAEKKTGRSRVVGQSDEKQESVKKGGESLRVK